MAEQELKKYAVIGNPIDHSLSPEIHTHFAKDLGIDLSYIKIKADLDGFSEVVNKFFDEGGLGCNVTLPFKQNAFDYVQQSSELAKITGSVNTIYKNEGIFFGDSTDGIGFISDLEKNKDFYIKDKRILILGAGGASMGIIPSIFLKKPLSIKIYNRTYENAKKVIEKFSILGDISILDKENIEKNKFDLVINATSQGMSSENFEVPVGIFEKGSICYDLSYGPAAKNFMNYAKENQLIFYDGLGMLIEQAAESFFIWEGIRPNVTKRLYEKLLAITN